MSALSIHSTCMDLDNLKVLMICNLELFMVNTQDLKIFLEMIYIALGFYFQHSNCETSSESKFVAFNHLCPFGMFALIQDVRITCLFIGQTFTFIDDYTKDGRPGEV